MYSPFVIPGPDQNSRPTGMAEALRNLQHAVAQCHDAVFIADAAGVITRVNAAFELLTGYSSVELIGKDLSLITDGGGQSPEYQQIWRDIFEEKHYAGRLELKKKSGPVCEVEATITPVRGSHQHVVSLVGTCHEIERSGKTAMQVLSGNESGAELGRMIHDLRNMLLVVVAHADLACESLSHEHPSRRNLENVRSAAQSAAALVHGFARSEDSTRSTVIGNTAPLHANPAAVQGPHASRLRTLTEPHEQIENLPATILMVEDESLIRESTVDFLAAAGFNVISAGNGEEAVLEAQRHQENIDILVTDLVLANMSGAELALSITTSHPEARVLIISGHPESEARRNSSYKWEHFLAKPFSFSVLHSTIRELLQQKKRPRSATAGS